MLLTLGGLYIFFARVADMSLATFRILMLMRGRSFTAALIGFLEAGFYIFALSEVIKRIDNPLNMLFFAGGFAAGTYIGSFIEELVALGYANVQIISLNSYETLKERLREEGFGVTAIEGCGKDGLHYILYVLTKRRNLSKLIKMVNKEDPKAFFSVSDTRKIVGGFFPRRKAK